jgi:putative FmdB family regulatory protein
MKRLLKSEHNTPCFEGYLRVPLYEYQCQKCKHKFEKIQKFSDRPIRKCPQCGGPVEKIQHAPAVQFKGTGWYVTDYGGRGGDKSKSDAGAEKGSSDKKETTAKEDSAKGKDKEVKHKKTETKKSKD